MAKEISDAEIDFISLVDKAANNHKFLIMKQKERENTMKKNIELDQQTLETIVEKIASSVYTKVLADLNEAGICQLDEETGAIIQKSGKHYLSGIVL